MQGCTWALPQTLPKATASTECGRLPGWQRQGHITPLKPLLTPSLLQSGMSKEKEVNLLEIFFQPLSALQQER